MNNYTYSLSTTVRHPLFAYNEERRKDDKKDSVIWIRSLADQEYITKGALRKSTNGSVPIPPKRILRTFCTRNIYLIGIRVYIYEHNEKEVENFNRYFVLDYGLSTQGIYRTEILYLKWSLCRTEEYYYSHMVSLITVYWKWELIDGKTQDVGKNEPARPQYQEYLELAALVLVAISA
ncbi:hypothetical protein BDB01DRAFT_895037 [Pilobolus umbonatus]|nr:hypothetical protein BDB01DRAFT_895037 [Pilobolus umbonatus]